MSRTSTIPASEEGNGSLYETILAHSNEPRWFVLSPSIVSPTESAPTRAEVISGFMSIAIFTPFKDASGMARMGEPRFPTRDQAERAAGRYGLAMEGGSAA